MLLPVILLFYGLASANGFASDPNKEIETAIMQNYNRKHRPVKKDSTTVQVKVQLMINHVEEVDEHEQTMKLHGLLWATWYDEYLIWDPATYNNTRSIAIESWKIWQPSLALYNSARGNGWHLYMHGVPATVNSDGKVLSSGTFSFHVTCLFDFSNYPYDEQNCPIVIADWVYDLSRVNLSDPLLDERSKPMIRLSFDPMSNEPKTHVAGWEIHDSWRNHCYWGPNGCKEGAPVGQAEWFWSLLEFGVKIKRQAPYYGLTVVLPTLITCLLALAVFWIDDQSVAITLTVLNILLQGVFGWDLVQQLPPGNSAMPKIVILYGVNLGLSAFSFLVHILIQHLEFIVPEDIELPFQFTNLTERLREIRLFQTKGLSFDPQLLLNGDSEIEADSAHSPQPTNEATLIDMMSAEGVQDPSATQMNHISEESDAAAPSSPSPDQKSTTRTMSHLGQQLYVVRRVLFFVYAIIYVVMLPICLF